MRELLSFAYTVLMGGVILGAILGAIVGSTITFFLQKYLTHDAAAEVAGLRAELGAFKKESETREQDRNATEHLRLSAQLRQGVYGSYIVYVKNESDEEVRIETIHFARDGVDLSRPAKPTLQDDWQIPAGQVRDISWSAQPDPVDTLSRLDPQIAIQRTSPFPVQLVLTCRVRDRIVYKSITRLVAVEYSARRMTDYGP